MARTKDEAGFTLIELLVAGTLMLIIMGALLTSFNGFANTSKRNTILNDQQDSVRNTLDQIVRQARNLANPTTFSSTQTATTIAVADQDKVSFQTTDPLKQWVSYCMSGASGDARVQLWYETSSSPGLTPTQVADTSASDSMGSGCPSTNSNWQRQVQIADYVSNRAGDRPLFTYYPSGSSTAMTPPVAQGDSPKITRVVVTVFLDIDPTRPPVETVLRSAAFMRNQNQAPSALFTAKAGTSGQYTFDAGDSVDPEGRTLAYDWYSAPGTINSTDVPSNVSTLPSCAQLSPSFPAPGNAGSDWTCIGNGVVVPITFNTATLPKYVFLRVTDPGQLQVMSAFPIIGCPTLAVADNRTESQCLKVT